MVRPLKLSLVVHRFHLQFSATDLKRRAAGLPGGLWHSNFGHKWCTYSPFFLKLLVLLIRSFLTIFELWLIYCWGTTVRSSGLDHLSFFWQPWRAGGWKGEEGSEFGTISQALLLGVKWGGGEKRRREVCITAYTRLAVSQLDQIKKRKEEERKLRFCPNLSSLSS